MPLFSKSHKNPAEIVKILKENMAILEKQEKKTDKHGGLFESYYPINCTPTAKLTSDEHCSHKASNLYV
uniref:Uncharacterized protein n=1 Tax=Anas platyrhynchos TaxID=8839 RepID=A0A8B9SGX0_ANAPL